MEVTNIEWQIIKVYENILFDFSEGTGRVTIDCDSFTSSVVQEIADALHIYDGNESLSVMYFRVKGNRIIKDGVSSKNVLDIQELIESSPKAVILDDTIDALLRL